MAFALLDVTISADKGDTDLLTGRCIVRQLPEAFMVNNKDVFVAWTPIGHVAKINKR